MVEEAGSQANLGFYSEGIHVLRVFLFDGVHLRRIGWRSSCGLNLILINC